MTRILLNSKRRLKQALLLASAIAVAGITIPVQAQQLGYTLVPTATRVSWDDAFPLQDDWMYGGRLSLLFGSQVELQPFFLRGNRFGVDSARGPGIFGLGTQARTLRVDHMGVNVQVNLGKSDLVPFIRAGGGLLKFDPDSGENIQRLTINAGAGLRLNLGSISGEVFAEQSRFRMTPTRLFGIDTMPLPAGESAPMIKNMNYGASINIPLSTFDGQDESAGLRGTRAPLEPFVGRLSFNDKMGLADQDLFGARTGIDFGPQFGLRGFYWRGANRDHDRTDRISGYGGEAQFTLSEGRGIKPFVVLGAGRIDYLKGYLDLADKPREDETALIAGGGASFFLTDRVQLNVAIRDYITTQSEEFSTTRDTDDLLHNRMLSAGMTFSIGGSSSASRERRQVAEREQAQSARDVRDSRVRDENMRRDDRDRMRDDMRTGVRSDSLMRSRQAATGRRMVPDSMHVMMSDGSGRVMMLPVPTVGEIIIRYGIPGASVTRSGKVMQIDTVRVVRRVDTASVLPPTLPPMSQLEPNIAARLAADSIRMDAMARQLEETRIELERVRNERAVGTGTVRTTRAPRMEDSNPSVVSRIFSAHPADITPFVGFSTGNETQFVAAARLNLGPLSPGSRFDLVPEISLAVGGGNTTLMGMANARYTLGNGTVQPYLMLGGGLSTDALFVVGTSVGASMNLRSADMKPLYGFAEVQGINLFNRTRLLIGISTRR